jgi:hypothetical protein
MVVFSTIAVTNRAIHSSSEELGVSPLLDGSCSLTTGSSACAEEQLARSRRPQSKDFTKHASCCYCFEICKIKKIQMKKKKTPRQRE